MKFLLEFVTCCVSCPPEPQPVPQEIKLLILPQPEPQPVPQEPRRRKHWMVRGAHHREWRPSLTSISEDDLTEEKVINVDREVRRRRWSFIKRKIVSMSRRDRRRSLDHEDCRRSTPLSSLLLSPSPVMLE